MVDTWQVNSWKDPIFNMEGEYEAILFIWAHPSEKYLSSQAKWQFTRIICMIEKTCIEVLSSSTFNMNLLLNKSRLDLHSPLADLSKLKTLIFTSTISRRKMMLLTSYFTVRMKEDSIFKVGHSKNSYILSFNHELLSINNSKKNRPNLSTKRMSYLGNLL